MVFPRGFRAHDEVGLALGRQGRISSQNMIVGCTNYSNQLESGSASGVAPGSGESSSGWHGTYNIVFVKSNGTDYLYILSGPAITGPCDAPMHELLEQGESGRHKVGTPVKILTGVWVVS